MIDGVVGRHELLGAIIDTDWATRLDIKVAKHIIQRYYAAYGNSRTSLRYLAGKTGAERANVVISTKRLVDHGAFWVIREGAGTRPTEYGLNFAFSSSGIADDTSSSGIAGNTSSGIADDTSSGSSGIAGNTESHLHVPVTNRVHDTDTSPPYGEGGGAASPAGDIPSGFATWTVTEATFNDLPDDDFELVICLTSAADKKFKRRLSLREYRSFQDATIPFNPDASDPGSNGDVFVGAPVWMSRRPTKGHYSFLPAGCIS